MNRRERQRILLDAAIDELAKLRDRVGKLEAILRARDLALLARNVEDMWLQEKVLEDKLEQIEGWVTIQRNVSMAQGQRLTVLTGEAVTGEVGPPEPDAWGPI